MKKMIAVSASLIAISLSTACGQAPMQMNPQQNLAAQNAVRAQSNANTGATTLNLTKTASTAIKQGSTELKQQS